MKIGILYQPGALWIGAHYSPFCKRWCINIIPLITFWIMLEGGKEPYTTRKVETYRSPPAAAVFVSRATVPAKGWKLF